MLEKLEIRESRRDDSVAIESLYSEAFPKENLLPLVRDLLNDSAVTISLIGTIDSQIVGHVIFTVCGVAENSVNATLLGPLAVAPAWQKQGVGSAIVQAGLRWLEDSDVNLVLVLGDPAFYGRLGFLLRVLMVEPPYPLPPEWEGAWQSQYLGQPPTIPVRENYRFRRSGFSRACGLPEKSAPNREPVRSKAWRRFQCRIVVMRPEADTTLSLPDTWNHH